MDTTIFLFLVQDGTTNGALYALLALALVLVFAVTRIIFIPQGEFVAFGALTYAVLATGALPGTVWLLVGFGAAAFAVETWSERHALTAGFVARQALFKLALPVAVLAVAAVVAPARPGPIVAALLTVAIVAPIGPFLYRVAFHPMAEASILVLLIAAVGVHFALTGLALLFFGAEGLRAPPLWSASVAAGPLTVTGQSLSVYAFTALLMGGLYVFFARTLWGKALLATAVNRLGARLVGVPTTLAGEISVALAAVMGAVSGILMAPITTVYYDTGFLIGLKGFVAATIAGLLSFPGAAVAALAVGIVEAFASFFASAFTEIIVFMLLVPVLLVRSVFSHAAEEDE